MNQIYNALEKIIVEKPWFVLIACLLGLQVETMKMPICDAALETVTHLPPILISISSLNKTPHQSYPDKTHMSIHHDN
jgi:hypothetical protein